MAELSCLDCGACCRDASDGRILVSASDLLRWRRAGLHRPLDVLTEGHFSLAGMGARADGACLFLGVGDRTHACQIYDDRPDTCRDLEVGSPQCLEYRRDRGVST